MLLDEQEEEEDPEPHEEEEYFLRAKKEGGDRPRSRPPPAGGARPRPRPAPAIVTKPGSPAEPRSPSRSAPAPARTPHLFPRNLKTDYPVAVRAEGIWIYDSAGRKYLDGCGGAVVC